MLCNSFVLSKGPKFSLQISFFFLMMFFEIYYLISTKAATVLFQGKMLFSFWTFFIQRAARRTG